MPDTPVQPDPLKTVSELIEKVQILTGVPAVEVSTTAFIVGMVFRAVKLVQRTQAASIEVNNRLDGLVRLEEVLGQPLVVAPDVARLRTVYSNPDNQARYPMLFAALERERDAAFHSGAAQRPALERLAIAWQYLRPVVNEGRFDQGIFNEQLGHLLTEAASPEKYRRLLEGLEVLLPAGEFSYRTLVDRSVADFVARLHQQTGSLNNFSDAAQADLEARYRQALEEAVLGEDGAINAALRRMQEKQVEALNQQRQALQDQLDAADADDAETRERLKTGIEALDKEIKRVNDVHINGGAS